LTPNHLVSTLKVSGSTPKIKSQHLNLEVDIKSFGVYPESLRVNPQILSYGQSSNLVINYQIWWLTFKFGG